MKTLKDKQTKLQDLIYFGFQSGVLFTKSDVKQAVLEFENVLKNSLWTKKELKEEEKSGNVYEMELHNQLYYRLINKHREIFGDFERMKQSIKDQKKKLLNKKNWYMQDLNNYNEDFLKEIIIDLYEKLDKSKQDLLNKMKNEKKER